MSDEDMNEIKAAQVLKCLADALTYGLYDSRISVTPSEDKKTTEFYLNFSVNNVKEDKKEEVPF